MKQQYIYLIIGGALVLTYVIYNERTNILEKFNDLTYDPTNSVATSGNAINNPLNIKKGNAWLGMITSPSAIFCSFSDQKYSFRAGTKILRNYVENDGMVTLQDCIYRYAPSTDNNTPAIYTQTVANATGLQPSTNMAGIIYTPTLVNVLLAMASVQQGNNYGELSSTIQSATDGYNLT